MSRTDGGPGMAYLEPEDLEVETLEETVVLPLSASEIPLSEDGASAGSRRRKIDLSGNSLDQGWAGLDSSDGAVTNNCLGASTFEALVPDDHVVALVLKLEMSSQELHVYQPQNYVAAPRSLLWWGMPKTFEVRGTGSFFDASLERWYRAVHAEEESLRTGMSISIALVTWLLFIYEDLKKTNPPFRLCWRATGAVLMIATLLLRRFSRQLYKRHLDSIHGMLAFLVYSCHHAMTWMDESVHMPFAEMLIIWVQHAFVGLPFVKLFPIAVVEISMTLAHNLYLDSSINTLVVLLPALIGTVFASQGLCIMLEGQVRKIFAERTRLFSLCEVQHVLSKRHGIPLPAEMKHVLKHSLQLSKSTLRLQEQVHASSLSSMKELRRSKFSLRFDDPSLEQGYQNNAGRRKRGDLVQWASIVLSETIASMTVDWLAQRLDPSSDFLADVLMVRCLGILPCALCALVLCIYSSMWKQYIISILAALAGSGTIATSALAFSTSAHPLARAIYEALVLRCFFLVFMIRIPRNASTIIGVYLFAVYMAIIVLLGLDFMTGIFCLGVVVCGPYVATVAERRRRRIFLLHRAYETVLRNRRVAGGSAYSSTAECSTVSADEEDDAEEAEVHGKKRRRRMRGGSRDEEHRR